MPYEMKPLFKERMQTLLPNQEDFTAYDKIVHIGPRNWIRCNTLKISPDELMSMLSKKWKVKQPYPSNPEIILIEQDLKPGELGNALEHVVGYYYVQELSSMLSVIALQPKPDEFVIDLCASPGSKTSQIAAKMENTGTLIANDVRFDRIRILSGTLERTGVSNALVTQEDGIALSNKLFKLGYKADKILLDAPCSGEGTLRSSPKTFLMWNPKMIKNISRMQKKLLAQALKILKVGGTLVYSTCTHAPEENEEIIDFALQNFKVKIEPIKLPVKSRPGIDKWYDETYNPEVCKACRIYPQDNDSEGFFVCKMTLLEEIKNESN